MKQKLNNFRLRVLMLVAFMCVAFTSQSWADVKELKFDFDTMGSTGWQSSYTKHTYDFGEGQVEFASANKQTSTITDVPVTKGQPVSIIMQEGYTISAASFSCKQWGTKSQTITLNYSTDGGENYTSTGTTSSNFSISNTSLPSGTNAVRITFSSSSNQVGIISATITYASAGGGDTPATFTVTYDGNGATAGDVPTDDTEYEENDEVTVLANTGGLAKSGCTFGGWNTQSDGEGTDYSAGNTFQITDNTTLYAKWNAKTVTSLACEGTPAKTTYYAGQSFDPSGLTVTATFSDASVEDVTSSVVWTPSPLTVGTTSVTASYMGQSVLVEGLTVTAAPGSAENPYTVAQAIAFINTLGSATSSEEVYVSGIISQVDSYNSKYSSITYWISDDGTTDGQMEVYSGKGIGGADFSSANDLNVGDVVVVKGYVKMYQSTPEFTSNNELVSLHRKQAAGLSFVKTSYTASLNDEFATPILTNPNNLIVTYSSNNTDVATVDENTGAVTLKAKGEVTITATFAGDDDFNEGAASYTITIVTQENPELSFGVDAYRTKIVIGEVTDAPALTTADGFNGTVVFNSSDNTVATISETGVITAQKKGTTTISATFEGNEDFFEGVTSYELTVGLDDASLEFDATVVNYTWGDVFTAPKLTANVGSTIAYESNNSGVASVDDEGNVTVKAVGTATITATAAATETQDGAEASYTINVAAPEAKTVIVSGPVFVETFSGNTGNNFSGSQENVHSQDNSGWVFANAYGAADAIKLGSSKNAGSATTPDIAAVVGTAYTLTFKAAPWSSESTYMEVVVEGGDITGVSDSNMAGNRWNDYTATIVATSNKMTITFTASKNRFFLDEVKVEAPSIKVNAVIATSGYGTLCSQYPLDFSATTADDSDYKAWYVTGIDGSSVMLEQVTGAIRGGEAVILCGNAGAYEIPTASSEKALDGNKLVGTLAPTIIAADEAYGLSQGQFKLINAGTIPAGKAYLPTSVLDAEVKAYTLVFNDATGVQHTEIMNANNIYYNLAGQRVARPSKGGIYIVNGKKVVIK